MYALRTTSCPGCGAGTAISSIAKSSSTGPDCAVCRLRTTARVVETEAMHLLPYCSLTVVNHKILLGPGTLDVQVEVGQPAQHEARDVPEIVARIELERWDPGLQLLERDTGFQPRHRSAQAEVDALAERQVLLEPITIGDELVALGEQVLVAVGRSVDQHQPSTLRHVHAAEHDIFPCDSEDSLRRTRHAQRFLDDPVDQRRVVADPSPHLGVLAQ